MAIQFKRSYTAGFVPTALDIDEGEVFINLTDQLIYSKDNLGNVVVMRIEEADETTPGLVSTTAQAFAGDKTFNGRIIPLGDAGLNPQNNITSFVSDDPSQFHIQTRVSGTNRFTVNANGSIGRLLGNRFNASSSQTIPDDATIVLATASGITLTLPSLANNDGRMILIRNMTTGTITIDRPGQTSESIGSGGGSLYITDGTIWFTALTK